MLLRGEPRSRIEYLGKYERRQGADGIRRQSSRYPHMSF